MQNAMKSVNDWNALHGYPELEMGIGINSGPAVVGNIGSADKMKYGCMGETVNLAGRVETFTTGGQIYISERTKAELHSELITSAEQSFMPKGAAIPMKIFAVDGIGDIHIAHREYIMRDIAGSHEVTFLMITGSKSIDEERHTGQILKISSDERYAVIKSDTKVAAMQNIMLDICGSLYAKVIAVSGQEITICFTSKPDSFSDWVNSLA